MACVRLRQSGDRWCTTQPMQLDLGDILATPACNVRHLAPHLIRFELPSPREPSPYLGLLLAGGDQTSTLFPGAPNREGIAEHFVGIRDQFVAAFSAHRACELFRLVAIDSVTAFVRFQVSHLCAPTFAYTNAVSVLTVLRTADDVWTIVRHDPYDFAAFPSGLTSAPPIDPEAVGIFSSLAAAETHVHSLLGRLEVRALGMTRGQETRTLLLQDAGRLWRASRNVVQRLAHFGGDIIKITSDGEEPFTMLNRLELDGFRPRTCATCSHFQFSGMSRDSSGGSKGYCGLRLTGDAAANRRARAIVSVFDVCEEHERKPAP